MEVFLPSFLTAFVTLFIVIDPILVTPIFASLTHTETPKKQFQLALMASLIAAGMLGFFAFFGQAMLDGLHVSIDAFRTSGGLLLFLMGFQMFFNPDGELEAKTPGPKASARENVAFFPIATPMLAGPGAIATIMLLMAGNSEMNQTDILLSRTAVISAMLTVLTIGVVIMSFAGRIASALGRTGMNLISRILGMLLMAMSTQYIFDGIRVGMLEKVGA